MHARSDWDRVAAAGNQAGQSPSFLREAMRPLDIGRLLCEAPPFRALCLGRFLCEASPFRARWRCSRLRSTTVFGQRRRAKEKLKVNVAAVRDLRDVIAGAPEGLFSTDLASEFLVAVVGVGDERCVHERFATTSLHFPTDVFQTKIPKSTAGHAV